MPQSQPDRIRFAAAEPFGVPPEQGRAVRDSLAALTQVRFASEPAFLAFIAPLGLSRQDIEAWCALGLIRRAAVLSGAKAEPIPYLAVGPRGVRELANAGMGQARGPARTLASYKRLHDVELGDFGLAVMALARENRLDLIGVQFDDKRLATSAPVRGEGSAVTRVPLQADAYVATRATRGPVGLLVEFDRGTTSPRRISDKYVGYQTWMRLGGADRDFGTRAMRVVTIVPDARRLEALHAVALKANAGKRSGFLLFVDRRDVDVRDPGRLLEPIARPLGNRANDCVPLFERRSGLRDPQAVAPSGGDLPGCGEATWPMPGDPGTSDRPPAVTARTQALTPWSAPGPLARGPREAVPRGTGRGHRLAGGRRPAAEPSRLPV